MLSSHLLVPPLYRYDVQYVSQRSDCEGTPPTAELSSRSRNESDVGPFSEWSLHGHITGKCS